MTIEVAAFLLALGAFALSVVALFWNREPGPPGPQGPPGAPGAPGEIRTTVVHQHNDVDPAAARGFVNPDGSWRPQTARGGW